jgi:hypothetical protein
MSSEVKAEVECTRYTSSGGRYRVLYQGKTLIEGERTPAFAACRALLAKGIIGKLAMYSLGGSTPRLMVDIKRGASLTIEEGASGIRLAPFREFSHREEERMAA